MALKPVSFPLTKNQILPAQYSLHILFVQIIVQYGNLCTYQYRLPITIDIHSTCLLKMFTLMFVDLYQHHSYFVVSKNYLFYNRNAFVSESVMGSDIGSDSDWANFDISSDPVEQQNPTDPFSIFADSYESQNESQDGSQDGNSNSDSEGDTDHKKYIRSPIGRVAGYIYFDECKVVRLRFPTSAEHKPPHSIIHRIRFST